MNLLKAVRPMIPTQRVNVKVFLFEFMKPLKEKENTQSPKTMINIRDELKKDSSKELIQLLREYSERQAKNDQIFLQLMQSMIVNNN